MPKLLDDWVAAGVVASKEWESHGDSAWLVWRYAAREKENAPPRKSSNRK